MMEKENLEAFICDVVATMAERQEEAEKESLDNPDDLFDSGRALAYFEIKDIIESRLKIYGIRI